jgi:N-acetylmuramoyl-L-alanine amidase
MTSGKEQSDPQLPKSATFPDAVRYLGITLLVSAVLATLFTAWTPENLNPIQAFENWLSAAESSEVTGASGTEESPIVVAGVTKVGIVAGHSGIYPETGLVDPGAICEDGLTELEVNTKIAELVVRSLQSVGFEVDLLEEFDSRLQGYRADALVSIHADACYYINDEATGYKVSKSAVSDVPQSAQHLVDCIIDRYARATQLTFHPGSITRDMTEYHSFYEINADTPAAIIETGFLYLDRDFLTQHPEEVARGIVDGILCYINDEPVNLFEGTP